MPYTFATYLKDSKDFLKRVNESSDVSEEDKRIFKKEIQSLKDFWACKIEQCREPMAIMGG